MNYLIKSVLLFFSCVVASSVALAQDTALRVCSQIAVDSDGDGFGWEFNDVTNDFRSCVVTSASAVKPVITNFQTGGTVNLQRAYWNANNDIANRKLRCEPFEFNQTTAVYEKLDPDYDSDSRLWFFKDTLYRHESLSLNFPRMNTVFQLPVTQLADGSTAENLSVTDPQWESDANRSLTLWTVNDGIYHGIMTLRVSPYVEIISRGAGTNNAVRVWHPLGESGQKYHECFDVEGGAFVPTGSPDAASDGLIPVDDSLIITTGSPVTTETSVLNLQTGSQVDLSNDRWKYNTQFAGRIFRCHRYEWEWRESSAYGSIDLDDSLAGWSYIFHPHIDGDEVRVTHRSFTSRGSARQWQTKKVSIANGRLDSWNIDEEYSHWELMDGKIRLWKAGENEIFHQCEVGKLTALATNSGSIGDAVFSVEEENFLPVFTGPTEVEPVGTGNEGEGSIGSGSVNLESSGGGGAIGFGMLLCTVLLGIGRRRCI